jgi:hypothetical protein
MRLGRYALSKGPTEQVSPFPHLRKETNPASETLCLYLEFWIMDEVQKSSNAVGRWYSFAIGGNFFE